MNKNSFSNHFLVSRNWNPEFKLGQYPLQSQFPDSFVGYDTGGKIKSIRIVKLLFQPFHIDGHILELASAERRFPVDPVGEGKIGGP